VWCETWVDLRDSLFFKHHSDEEKFISQAALEQSNNELAIENESWFNALYKILEVKGDS